MNCDICGEPMYLEPERYLELRRAGEQPRCRKNGCLQDYPKKRLSRNNTDIEQRGIYWTGMPEQKTGHGGPHKINIAIDHNAAFATPLEEIDRTVED